MNSITLIMNILLVASLARDVSVRVDALRAVLNLLLLIPDSSWMMEMHKIFSKATFILKVVTMIPDLVNEYNSTESRQIGCFILSAVSRSGCGRKILNSSGVHNSLFSLISSLYESGIEDKSKIVSFKHISSTDFALRQDTAAHALTALWGACDDSNGGAPLTFNNLRAQIKLLLKLSQLKSSSTIVPSAIGVLGAISSIKSDYALEIVHALDQSESAFDNFFRPLITHKSIRIKHLGLWSLRNLCSAHEAFRDYAVSRAFMDFALKIASGGITMGKEELENSVAGALLLSEVNHANAYYQYNHFLICIIIPLSIATPLSHIRSHTYPQELSLLWPY